MSPDEKKYDNENVTAAQAYSTDVVQDPTTEILGFPSPILPQRFRDCHILDIHMSPDGRDLTVGCTIMTRSTTMARIHRENWIREFRIHSDDNAENLWRSKRSTLYSLE
jgi:hypothetical protein